MIYPRLVRAALVVLDVQLDRLNALKRDVAERDLSLAGCLIGGERYLLHGFLRFGVVEGEMRRVDEDFDRLWRSFRVRGIGREAERAQLERILRGDGEEELHLCQLA